MPGFYPRIKKHTSVDYSKYLGPDWKPDFRKRNLTTISNHIGFGDDMAMTWLRTPSFIAYPFVKNTPGVSQFFDMLDSIIIERGDGAIASRENALQKIKDH